MQHDAHEFFVQLIDSINDCIIGEFWECNRLVLQMTA